MPYRLHRGVRARMLQVVALYFNEQTANCCSILYVPLDKEMYDFTFRFFFFCTYFIGRPGHCHQLHLILLF